MSKTHTRCRKGIWSSQAEHWNIIHCHSIPADRLLIDSVLTQLVSQPLRQRSNLKHSLDELQHPPHLLLPFIHTSTVSFHFLLPPLSTLSHLTTRLSVLYNLSAFSMHHSSDHDSISSYRLFFFPTRFFAVTQLVASIFIFSSSLICWTWGKNRKKTSSIPIKCKSDLDWRKKWK